MTPSLGHASQGNSVASVVIVGAGGFRREVLEILKDQNKISQTSNILGFIDEQRATWEDNKSELT